MTDSGTLVGERDKLVRIGNERIEFGFCLDDGGALCRLLDKQTGWQFCREEAAPASLFRLALRGREDAELEWIESCEAKHFDWDKEEDDKGATLLLKASGFGDRELEVTVRVRLDRGSALSRWRMEVANTRDATVCQLTCPMVSGLMKVGGTSAKDVIVFPRQGEGYLFRNPFPMRDGLPLCAGTAPDAPAVGVGRLHGIYPGHIPMQMCLYYNDQAGLYLATHDSDQQVKHFDVLASDEDEMYPAFSVSHLAGHAPGEDYATAYDTVLGVFHGDWHDGADIYKAWATKQWWCEKRLSERDIPDWMRTGFAVFQMSNYHMPTIHMNHPMKEIADTVNNLAADIGVPLMSLIFNWEGSGAWTGPAGMFPPREGETEFKRAMAQMAEAGNMGFVYIAGGCWYYQAAYDPPFDSTGQFEAEAKDYVIQKAGGETRKTRPASMLRAARLCPHAEYVRELQIGVFLKCLAHGCRAVQIDNFPCGGAEDCHDPAHGHPLGHGPWWSEAWARILKENRERARAKDPQCAMTTEGVSENFIPWLDMYDHRAGNMEYFGHYQKFDPKGGETIPLFNYVYNPYIGSYLAAFPDSNQPGTLYWTRSIGKSLAHGVVPTAGKYFPEPKELNPVIMGFFKKAVRAMARDFWPYLMFGEMLCPPKIDAPFITACYCKMADDCKGIDPARYHEITDSAIEHAAFRAEDGSIGYLFANVSEEHVSFDVNLSDYDTGAETYTVTCITDGASEEPESGVRLPQMRKIEIAPLTITLIQIRSEGTTQ